MPGVDLKPDAVVTALTDRPGLNVSAPKEVVVGGLKGPHAGSQHEDLGAGLPRDQVGGRP